jgi:GntR family transcriptional regulator
MALDIGWYPTRLLPGLVAQDLSGSLYSLLAEKYGLVIDTAEQTVWAESADRRTASELGVLPAAPLLLFRRTSSASGTRVEHITSWYRGDRYQVHLSMTRTHQ